ncbi:hypothetical protein BG006_005494 [Podila minutissima]|uniref:GRIP domain-containing protein n=1 Tax=Podila minutissima TaxID=64525 RepID=A0A9P5VR29_9FUNG|nr:hypothetical protein BG006_005494 [Podila minutissima]
MFSTLKDRLNTGLTTRHGGGGTGATPTSTTPAASGLSDARSSSDSNGSGTVSLTSQDTTNSSQSSKALPPPPSPSASSFVSRISTAAAGLSNSGLPSASLFRRPLQASRSSSELGHMGSFYSSGSLASSSSPLSPGARNWAVLVQKLTLDPIQEPADPEQLEKIRSSYKSIGDKQVEGAAAAASTPTTTVPEAVIEKLEVLQRYEARFPGEDTQMGSERRKISASATSGTGTIASSQDLASAFKRIVQEKVAIETILKASTPLEDLGDVEALEAHLQNMSSKTEMSMQEIRRLSDELRDAKKLKEVHELEAESQASMIENLQEQLSEAALVQDQALVRELEMLQSKQEIQRQLNESRQAEESLKALLSGNEEKLRKDIEDSLEKEHSQQIEQLQLEHRSLVKESEETASALAKEAQRLKAQVEDLETDKVSFTTALMSEKEIIRSLQENHTKEVQSLQSKIDELTTLTEAQIQELDDLKAKTTSLSLEREAQDLSVLSPTLTNNSTDDLALHNLHDKISALTSALASSKDREMSLITQLEKAHQYTPQPPSPQPVDSPEQLKALKQEREELSKKLAHLERVHQGTERDSQEKVKSFEHELKLLLEQKSRLEAQVQEKSDLLQQEQDRVAYEIERVTLELTAVKTAERFASSKVTELSKDRDQVVEKVIALEGRLERLKECKHGQEQSLTSQIEMLSEEKSRMLKKIQGLEAEHAKALDEVEIVRLELREANDRVSRSESQVQELENRVAYDKDQSDLEGRLSSVTAELETRGMDLIRTENLLSTLQESSKAEHSELSILVKTLTMERDTLKAEQTTLAAQIQELKSTLDGTATLLSDKENLLRILEQDNSHMSKSKTESQEKADELQSQLHSLTARERSLKESLELAKETIHQRDQDLEELQKAKVSLDDSLQKSTSLLKATQQEIKKQEKEKKQSEEEAEMAKLSALNAQQEIKSLTDKSSSNTSSLTTELNKAQGTLAKTERERDELTKGKSSLQDQIQRLKAELKALQATLDNSETQLAEYKHLLAESRDRADTLEELTSIARRVAETKVTEFEAMVARVTQLEISLSQAQEEIEEVKSSREIEFVEARMEAEKDIAELQALAETGDQEIARLKDVEEEHMAMIEDLEKERDSSKERIGVLELDVCKLNELKEQLELDLNTEKSLVQDQKALEQQAEECKNRECHLRTLNKTLKDEIRKLQKQIPGYSPQPSPSLHSPYTSGFPATPMPGNVSANCTGPRAMSLSSLMTPPGTPRFSRPLFQNAPDEDVNIEYLKNVMLSFMEHKERRIQLVPVVAQMLRLTPEETKRFSRNA